MVQYSNYIVIRLARFLLFTCTCIISITNIQSNLSILITFCLCRCLLMVIEIHISYGVVTLLISVKRHSWQIHSYRTAMQHPWTCKTTIIYHSIGRIFIFWSSTPSSLWFWLWSILIIKLLNLLYIGMRHIKCHRIHSGKQSPTLTKTDPFHFSWTALCRSSILYWALAACIIIMVWAAYFTESDHTTHILFKWYFTK